MPIKLTSLIIVTIALLWVSSSSYAKNQLDGHYSPYLAMHGNDPVHWMEWGEAALEKARKEKKLIFVSIGYYACHWCHVMHRESYSDPAIAKLLNQHYIAIKVDRELNPILDKRLINFVQATTGTAGWPLNVFITPEGYPLVGITYLPKTQFSAAIQNLNQQWSADPEQLIHDAKAQNNHLSKQILAADNQGDYSHINENIKELLQQSMQYANTLQGGFSQVRQFPSAAKLLALMRLQQDNNTHKALDDFIQLTLDNMQNKGLHDEIAGGFYRYTVDPDWHTPHFEKMLYSNALLAIIYHQAAKQYNNSSYQKTALETLDFLQADMQGKDGAFIASLSAVDNHNIEGGYYLWQQKELKQFLSKDELYLANLAWGLDQIPSLEAGILPMLTMPIDELATQLKQDKSKLLQNLKQLKRKFKQQRKLKRVIPRDDKLLAAWNGLNLAAFATLLPEDKSLKPTGEKLANFLLSLWDGKQLRRAKNSQKSGTVKDYAAVAWGLVQWGKAANNEQVTKVAIAIIDTAWKKFYSAKSWKESETSLLPDPLHRPHIEDSPIPSAEALLIEASQFVDNGQWQTQIKQVFENSTEEMEDNPFSYAYLLSISIP